MNQGDTVEAKPKDFPAWIMFAIIGVPIALIAVLAVIAPLIGRHTLEIEMRRCDEAIKATLIAPSTYKRVDGPGTFAIGDDNRSFAIEYDAQNSFGVPIRRKGFCTISADRSSAKWVRMPPFD